MSNTRKILASSLLTCLLAQTLQAQMPLPPFAKWTDACSYPAIIPLQTAPEIFRLLEAEAILIPASQIVRRTDNPSYYRLTSTSPLTLWNATTPMCIGAPFLNESRAATQGRSGFLVANNIIATASHSFSFDPSGFAIVFDMNAGPLGGPSCSAPSTEYIHEDRVYFPRLVDPLIANAVSNYNDALVDYAAFYLDRPVSGGRRHLRLRRNSSVRETDEIAMASHPKQLRTKLEYGIRYQGDKPTNFRPYSYHSFTGFNLFDGSSGAPAYNLTRGFVEASVGNITGQGCTIVRDQNPGTPAHCISVDDGCHESWSDPLFVARDEINVAPIEMFSSLVPTPELRVSPLDDLTHVFAVGALPQPSVFNYTATASPHAPASTQLTVTLGAGTPALLARAPISQSLSPGASLSFSVSASIPRSVTCGVYDRSVIVTDTTNGYSDVLRHRFEIGLTDFSISTPDVVRFQGVVPPMLPSSIDFVVTNTRPTPVSIVVSTTASWLKIGTASNIPPGQLVSLAAAGTPGESQTISATVDPAQFSALAVGDHSAEIVFTNTAGCPVTSERRRSLSLSKGKIRFERLSDALIPTPTPTNAPYSELFVLPQDFCISDVELGINTGTSTSGFGRDLSLWVNRLWLSLEKDSGVDSVGLALWQNNPLPLGWNIPERYDNATATTIKTLLLQTVGNVSPNWNALGSLIGKNGLGTWKISITDIGDGTTFTEAYLESMYLEIDGVPGACPFY